LPGARLKTVISYQLSVISKKLKTAFTENFKLKTDNFFYQWPVEAL